MPATSTSRSPRPLPVQAATSSTAPYGATPARSGSSPATGPPGRCTSAIYFGTLENRVRLQELGVELLVLVADYQTITDRVAPRDSRATSRASSPTTSRSASIPTARSIFAHSQVPELNQLILPFLSLVSVAELGRNPTVKDEIAADRRRIDVGAHVHLPRPPGRRHPLLPGEPRPGRQGPAAPPRAHADDRAPVQRALQPRCALLPRARGAAQRGAAPARPRRSQDGQEPRQLDRRSAASADETARLIRAREDRLRAAHHLRARAPARRSPTCSRSPRSASGARRPRSRTRSATRGRGLSRASSPMRVNEHLRPIRSRRAELTKDPGYLRSVLQRGNERRETDRRRHARQRAGAHAHDLLTLLPGVSGARRMALWWIPSRARIVRAPDASIRSSHCG